MKTAQKRRLESLRHSFRHSKCFIPQEPQKKGGRHKASAGIFFFPSIAKDCKLCMVKIVEVESAA
jgi:hypothetical protein